MFEYSQSYNRYSYCFNNPLRFTDPSGYVVRGRNDVLNPQYFIWLKSSNSKNGNSFNTDIVEGSPSPISFNLLVHSASLDDGLVYGHITLKRYPNHKVRAYSDRYDFNFLFGIFLSFFQSHSSLCSFEKNKNLLKDKIINHLQSNL